MPSAPLFRFGVIADPQYADLAPNLTLNRYPANSLDKLRAAVEEFNRHDLAFVVTLGDIIDREWKSFDAVLPVYQALRHRKHFLLGNHDFAVAPQHLGTVPARVGMPSPYYDFSLSGYRFIALDGNEISVFAPPEGDPRRQEAKDLMKALEIAARSMASAGTGRSATNNMTGSPRNSRKQRRQARRSSS